jgi:hypothetical protein
MKKNNAIKHYKTAAKLARVLGIAKQAVFNWGEVIPQKQAFRLDRITHGALKYDPSFYEQTESSDQFSQ